MSEPRHSRPIRSLGESLRRLSEELGMGEVHTTAAVVEQWDAVVGPDVARHARAVKLRDGILTVEVDDPGWGSQLRYLGGELAERLNAAIGGTPVRELRVVVSRGESGRGRGGRASRG